MIFVISKTLVCVCCSKNISLPTEPVFLNIHNIRNIHSDNNGNFSIVTARIVFEKPLFSHEISIVFPVKYMLSLAV